MLQGSSRPESRQMRLGSVNVQSNMSVPCLAPATEPDSSLIPNSKTIYVVSFDASIQHPQLITISLSDLNESLFTAALSV
jgi:hypothetical protein